MSTRSMTLTAMLTALLCIVGPLTLPIGPVPLSLTTAVLFLAALLTGPRRAMLCCGVYLLIGGIGLPVFSGFRGGISVLMGPTGGFLLGYLPMTALGGLFCRGTSTRLRQAGGFLAGSVLLYLTGTLWYAWQTGTSAGAAIAVCVLPFLPGDAVKLAGVLLFGNAIKSRLEKAGLLK